jgi:hypothetical protein
MLTTQCGHRFHAPCLHQWLGKLSARNTCPLCRQLAKPLSAPLSDFYRYDITNCIRLGGILEGLDWYVVNLKLYDVLDLSDVVHRVLVEYGPGRTRITVVFRRPSRGLACVAPLERIQRAIRGCDSDGEVRCAIRRLKRPGPLTTPNADERALRGRVVRNAWEWAALAILTRLWSTFESEMAAFVWEARPLATTPNSRPDILGVCCWGHYRYRANELSSYDASAAFEGDTDEQDAQQCFGCPLCTPMCAGLDRRIE